MTFKPYIKLARYAAEYRNYYWESKRKAKGDRSVVPASGISPYPIKSDKISDRASSDSGSNFGRLARYGIMDTYLEEMKHVRIRGIEADVWASFFKSQVGSD